MAGLIYIAGLGPGDPSLIPEKTQEAISQSEVLIGYDLYFQFIPDLILGKDCRRLPLSKEIDRAEMAFQEAKSGKKVCVISSGDAGIYGMASLVFEVVKGRSDSEIEIIVLPGISAINACASILGAPLGHDFSVISLSDLLTPWEKIEQRIHAAAQADFVIVFMNPRSKKREWQLEKARDIVMCYRGAATPAGIVHNAFRKGQKSKLIDLEKIDRDQVDMLSAVIVGNSMTKILKGAMVTPRGYLEKKEVKKNTSPKLIMNPQGIMEKSFQMIEQETQGHKFSSEQWPVVRRMIHACGDTSISSLVLFQHNAVTEGIRAIRGCIPIVTDVQMISKGISRRLLKQSEQKVFCFIDNEKIAEKAVKKGVTRSYQAMEKAVKEIGEAVYVIGNAPTALFALCRAVQDKLIQPRLIIAMPVGFVSVIESKEMALNLNCPVITISGRRGGSAMAAAAMNALLQSALSHPES